MHYINNTNIVSYTCTCNTSLTQFVTTQFTCIVGFRVNISKCKYLTLRGLSLFRKMFPISNTVISAAYILATVHFLYPKLGSFSNMDYYFYQLAHRDSKVPKRFVGLIQMQCSPSFDCNWGKQNDPIVCWHQLHPRFRVLQQGKCLTYTPDCVGGDTETQNCVGCEGAAPFKIPPVLVILAKGQPKNHQLFWPFSWADA